MNTERNAELQPAHTMEYPSVGEFVRHQLNTATSALSVGAQVWEWLGYGLLLLTAAAMRLWDLGYRAQHHDESLHSFYSWQLADGGGFAHNPLMHGPLQFEANAAIFLLFGDSDYTSRLLYALAGIALVALPFFFRSRLGRLGAFFTSVMLAFSPAMLYFSRFARNDILMAVWVLGLVICLWRFIDEGKQRYIYIAAALLALAFATKETAYMVTALLGLFLALMLFATHFPRIIQSAGIQVGETSSAAAIGRIVSSFWRNSTNIPGTSGAAAFLLVLVTITLPLWSAAIGIFQETSLLSWTNLTFIAEDGTDRVGAPVGGATLIAFVLATGLAVVSVVVGSLWNQRVWMIAAGVFYIIWLLLYTTFLTNPGGINSGVWDGLGYWIAQQDVARGNQPWYYYLIITPLYEFLPVVLSITAAVYYWVKRKRDAFTLFLLFWVGMTLLLFTIASEKMPWLLVNIALPLIVLAGKFLGELVSRIQWRSLVSADGIAILAGVPAFLFALYKLALFGTGDGDAAPLMGTAYALAVAALIAGSVYLVRRLSLRQFAVFAVIPFSLVLLGLTVRAGVVAAYHNGDVPVEMLVYTQTSPDIPLLVKEIEHSNAYGEGGSLSFSIDDTSGFTWPWAWYLRHSNKYQVGYRGFDASEFESAELKYPVVLVHSNNNPEAEQSLQGIYTDGERIRHRWWFPEHTYRHLTPAKIISGLVDREAWRSLADYWLFRKGVRHIIGSEDAYVYFAPDFPQNFQPYQLE